ncbi:InlB B-repeat-containing protein [Ralstonia solanacearum]|uniref:InlB B-repeat-containing protein n=1 Tax=Ralstonia solanacearum TaxID=305 RepID=UPI0013010572|nr:InlB B-repeat-containing protein [Ralstonia solanacearum]
MPNVVYNGNGSTGGVVPVDATNYAAGSTVTVAAPGTLARSGATFLYWNTAADGSGTYHGGIADSSFAFPNQPGNLTLFAIWAITTGLAGGGVTTHYTFAYEEKLGGPGGIEPARTNSVIASCENDYSWMQTQFAGVTPGTLPIPTLVSSFGGGASWWPLTLKPGGGGANFVRELIIAEVVEMFMAAQHKGWGYSNGVGDEESCGEALSLFLLVQFQISIGDASLISTGSCARWLNTSLPASNPASTEYDGTNHYGARADWINATEPFAGNGPGTGCSLLFLYYLFHQLGFSIPAIIAAAPGLDSSNNLIGGSCLRGVYRNLTGDSSDPFPYFASLLAAAFPPNQVSAIGGTNHDDPWPLATLSFVGAKNTWGHDEINDIIGNGGTYPDGVYLALDGFSRNILQGASPSLPAIAFGGVTSVVSTTPPAIYYSSTNLKAPQQILFAFDIHFATPLGNFPATGETAAAVTSSINVLGKAFPAATEFFFLAGADPYFTNVVQDPTDPSKLTVPWLSEDLRVFTATPGAPGQQTPVPGGPQFIENSVGGAFDFVGAYAYIQALLVYLNQNYGNPSGIDPFLPSSNVIPQQQSEFTADSSVTPFTTIGANSYNNYSFALARVRLRGSQGSAGAATGVKVFFRIWGTQSADTGWDLTSTYLSHNDASGNPLWPQAPADNHTVPFFATSAAPNFGAATDTEFATGGFTNTGANNLTITIAQGDSQWAYFGCFLDVNDSSRQVNGVSVSQAFPGGTHHCLVAQIAYAGAPIQTIGGNVPTPESSDQLAQRNMQVTTSDNPGPASAHRVPQTFEVKPSAAPLTIGPLAGRTDELMIDWGEIPEGSTARIYWPAVSSAEVVRLASWMYGVHPLTAFDGHTIECKTIKGMTFVPIPQGTGPAFAGLFTVDLPQTVTTGEEFNVVVRRIGKRPLRWHKDNNPVPTELPPALQLAKVANVRRSSGNIDLPEHAVEPLPGNVSEAGAFVAALPAYERYIVGSFQVKIPVSTREAMLPAEENTLAILKARLEALPKTNRWYPVLLRFIDQIAGRVNGLGGDADAIPPSLLGYHHPMHSRPVHLHEFTGKVSEVMFDCFGDFVGFALDNCCDREVFESREKEIGELVLRALRDRLTLTVLTAEKSRRIVRLMVTR